MPPPPEQKKIAEILTTVDGAIEKTTQIIEKAEELKKGLMLLSSTQAVPIINKGEFSRIKIPIPPIPEQKEIGNILSSVDNEIEKESNHKEQLELLKKGLMQVLLTGKLRVSI